MMKFEIDWSFYLNTKDKVDKVMKSVQEVIIVQVVEIFPYQKGNIKTHLVGKSLICASSIEEACGIVIRYMQQLARNLIISGIIDDEFIGISKSGTIKILGIESIHFCMKQAIQG